MQEEYLHYLFQHKLLGNSFLTSENKVLNILKFGTLNPNSGPDFLQSQIEFDNKKWAGHIEFHIKSSDWIKHKHQNDINYQNVIAHFVFEHDEDIYINQFKIPTVELKSKIDWNHFQKYQDYKNSKNWIPCQNDIQKIDPFIVYQQKEKALFQRLSRKNEELKLLYEDFNCDLKKIFFYLLFKCFGGKVNQLAFLRLFEKINEKHLSNLNYETFKIQAYLFGLSGFLINKGDEYHNNLKVEFEYQTKKFNLTPLSLNEWKFSRMRPFQFPTLKIAQLSEVLTKNLLITDIINTKNLDETFQIQLNDYWQNHFKFNVVSNKKISKELSKDFLLLIKINVVVPYLFFYGNLINDENIIQKSIDILIDSKPEKNNILEKWKSMGIHTENAFDSQSLIEQKNEICAHKKCLTCKIGINLIS